MPAVAFPRITLLLGLVLAIAPATRSAESTVVRVMSYNIHHGEGLDQKLDLDRIAKLIRDAKADIVGLQEVDRGCERTQKRDLPAELAQLTGLRVQFAKNIAYQGGEYGNAVLSRYPIKRTNNTHYRMLQPGEQRGALQLVLDVDGRDVLFINTHLDYQRDDAERLSNVEELRAMVVAAGPMPVIMVGDFNAAPDSRAIVAIKTFMTDSWQVVGHGNGFTIPVRKPAKRIDYIFVTGATVQPRSIEVLQSEASDHLPVIAELKL